MRGCLVLSDSAGGDLTILLVTVQQSPGSFKDGDDLNPGCFFGTLQYFLAVFFLTVKGGRRQMVEGHRERIFGHFPGD